MRVYYKRDMDLIRLILKHYGNVINEEEKQLFENYEDDQVKFHKYILIEAKYMIGTSLFLEDGTLRNVNVKNLTWEGYDLLESIKDDGIWKETKKRCLEIGTFSIPIIQRIASKIFIDLINGMN